MVTTKAFCNSLIRPCCEVQITKCRCKHFYVFPETAMQYFSEAFHKFYSDRRVPVLALGLNTTAELMFTFLRFLIQTFHWQPVARTIYPADVELQGVDVFICIADPRKSQL